MNWILIPVTSVLNLTDTLVSERDQIFAAGSNVLVERLKPDDWRPLQQQINEHGFGQSTCGCNLKTDQYMKKLKVCLTTFLFKRLTFDEPFKVKYFA